MVDLSLGNPRLNFKAAAQYACDISDENMSSYLTYSQRLLSDFLWHTSDFFRYTMGLREYDSQPGIGLTSLTVTHGSTHGYELVLKLISKKFNELRLRTEQPKLKPVIVMVAPLYGFFTAQPRENDFEIVYVNRDIKNGWALNPKDVANMRK